MRRLAILLLIALAPPAGRAATPALSLEQYKAELESRIAQLDSKDFGPADAHRINASLPPEWAVSDGTHQFTVPLLNVRMELDQIARGDRNAEASRQRALGQLRMLRAALDEQSANADDARARQAANEILSRREFRFVKGQTWWQQQQAKFWSSVAWLLGKIFGAAFGWSGTRWIVYGLAGVILAIFAFWIARLLLRGSPEQLRLEFEPAISERSAGEWLAEARAAAAQAQWREAVRLAYWAGISSLEAQGMWRPDRARTPREYLRLLGRQNSYFPSLMALTRQFERIWYGSDAATAEDFSVTIGQLEALGCR